MVKIHYHQFYCFDGVPLELKDDVGSNCTVYPQFLKSQVQREFNYALERVIHLKLLWFRSSDTGFRQAKAAGHIWIAIAYWNNGLFGVNSGVGKKPTVLN
jgi:hypothetical protein